ncbi:hypothetical protein [Polaribacter sp. IC073]|uniref:hypothetical protein n=1 Tax=Polaribacter sp. IC073 TaxID=2508540 RepID=UPI0011BF81C1|nr:hypothetical protein [Polaribacter sp. IC073]TXD47349.1 hypothetical protein ES045_12185 [Polaribacter sp. IC073]
MKNIKKVLIVCCYMEIGTTTLTDNIAESKLSEPITYRIKAQPLLEDYNPTIIELEQLPQKIKHRKKRKFHH